jgi:hypothetical protein
MTHLRGLFLAAVFLAIVSAVARADGTTGRSRDALVDELKKYEEGNWDATTKSASVSGKGLLDELGGLADKDLEEVFDQIGEHSPESPGRDLCLIEMIRRGGAHWEAVLRVRNDALVAKGGALHNVGVLTALRRVQKKEDPLPVLVSGKSEIRFRLGYAPQITANLTNLDPDKSPAGLYNGGDYRAASRHNKWRLQITDSDGQSLTEREEFDMGGFATMEVLEHHESIAVSLPIGAYVQISRPGTYTMTVLFHPEVRIACIGDVEGLICCRSIPIKLIVEPITIETTDAEQARLASLILKLPDKGEVKIVGGVYVPETVGKFLPAESPAAQLKIANWKAVPALIAAVEGEALNPTQRAWALGLLFGITDQNDPMEAPGVIGPFEYQHSGTVSLGGPGGSISVGQMSISRSGDPLDPKAQAEFTKSWKPWIEKGYIVVKKHKSPDEIINR